METRDEHFILSNGQLRIGAEIDTLASVEQAILFGGATDNIMDASAFTLGRVVLVGADGHDTLVGGSGDDILVGNSGDDILEGRAGNDLIGGGLGNDTYRFNLATPVGIDTLLEVLDQGSAEVVAAVEADKVAVRRASTQSCSNVSV